MADSAYLEKMGRELKCPICLSLLNSALSLTCNHVFCNLCISESMKSISNCPVCKVPFHRRELRAAPHMDNLVSIYKSMEAASGINIFDSQPAQLSKGSEGQTLNEIGNGSCEAENAKPQQSKLKKRKALKEVKKRDETASKSGPSVKPSFPAKKRVQVPLDPLSETPMRPEKFSKLGDKDVKHVVESNCSEIEAEGCKKYSSFGLMDKPTLNEKGDPLFEPFFWLREADDDEAAEDLSQQSASDHLTCTPRCKAPTFSDIMDTNDGSPIKISPTVEINSESKAEDIFDSEMFEWTQRACSPELCSTPMKKQATEKSKMDRIQEEKEVASEMDITCADSPDVEHGKGKTDRESPAVTYWKDRNRDAKCSENKTANKSNKPCGKVKRKHGMAPNTPIATSGEVMTSRGGKPGNSNQENENSKNSSSNKGREYAKNSEKRSYYCKRELVKKLTTLANKTVTSEVLDASIKSFEGSSQEEGNTDTNLDLPTTGCQIDNHKDLSLGTKSMKKHANRSKKQNFSTAAAEVLKEVTVNDLEQTQNQHHDNIVTGLPVSSFETGNGKLLDSVKKMRMKIKKADGTLEIDHGRKLGGEGCTTEVSKGDQVNASNENESHITAKHQGIKIAGGSKTNVKDLPEAEVHVLKKCKSISGLICCAFCQSCTDSEVSGKMLHYFKGKLVAADYNGGSHVIHSHRNCAEWAPNVFFEDDTAFNLEAELARSRRIKCSCCGIKGASLGCYEKSCRRSFHFPCAKFTPECRWDNENFVMLCPVHALSKLPNETRTQRQKNKRESQDKAVINRCLKTNGLCKWPFGSPCKWVICCSALSAEDKEMVSKFAKLAGASVLKTWNSAVTHVITSTDENGACKRTIKFLMGILEGKWILSIEWVKAYMTTMKPVSEDQYEISADVHGVKDGPRCGRQRVSNKEPKLFSALKFYFIGEFAQTYKGYLQDLVVAAGGIILQRKPISRGQERLLNETTSSKMLIVYSLEPPEKCDSSKNAMIFSRRRDEAQTLADVVGAKVVGHSWILDSIAAGKLQRLD